MIKAAGGRGRAQDKSHQTRGRSRGGVQTDEDSQLLSHKALSGPVWMHIEVHMGGATGDVVHLCELQCSVQRRFHKLVEMAPSTILPHHKESSSAHACRLDKDGACLEISRRGRFRIPRTLAHWRVGNTRNQPTDTSRAYSHRLANLERGACHSWLFGVPSCILETTFDSLLAKIVVVRVRDFGGGDAEGGACPAGDHHRQ
ncbi:hypothetical protein FIBSPDRAFT_422040 [Athelia psychrophila]|uniref:Carbamoyl phosphate synthase ATP-binding domain-containing protein n=1 Tax=Athelia psychrophila TaxID=1759441 RepID=A0A166MVA0_9AGAM|nr:hypothetical protein FIBSPDRAFT_422040 [Fibularhizoctonia sp. CBS 109695]